MYELNLVQLSSDEGGMANVEIDDGSDNGETSLGQMQVQNVQTDSEIAADLLATQ